MKSSIQLIFSIRDHQLSVENHCRRPWFAVRCSLLYPVFIWCASWRPMGSARCWKYGPTTCSDTADCCHRNAELSLLTSFAVAAPHSLSTGWSLAKTEEVRSCELVVQSTVSIGMSSSDRLQLLTARGDPRFSGNRTVWMGGGVDGD